MGLLDIIYKFFGAGYSRYNRIEKYIRENINVDRNEAILKMNLESLANKIEAEKGEKAARGLRGYIKSGKWKHLIKK